MKCVAIACKAFRSTGIANYNETQFGAYRAEKQAAHTMLYNVHICKISVFAAINFLNGNGMVSDPDK